jgi:hypothetical protein
MEETIRWVTFFSILSLFPIYKNVPILACSEIPDRPTITPSVLILFCNSAYVVDSSEELAAVCYSKSPRHFPEKQIMYG